MASTGMLADVANIARFSKSGIDPLPFIEVEASAASKQEHIISVVCKLRFLVHRMNVEPSCIAIIYVIELERSKFTFSQAWKEPDASSRSRYAVRFVTNGNIKNFVLILNTSSWNRYEKDRSWFFPYVGI